MTKRKSAQSVTLFEPPPPKLYDQHEPSTAMDFGPAVSAASAVRLPRMFSSSASSQRERGRTQSVNGAFQSLRCLIPTEPVDRKLSKIETLRLAASYIQHLVASLETSSPDETPCINAQRSHSSQSDVFGGDASSLLSPRRSVCTFCLARAKRSGGSGSSSSPRFMSLEGFAVK